MPIGRVFRVLQYIPYFQFTNNERATLARVTRVVIHSYLYSGLRPSVSGKVTFNNWNLRNLVRYSKNIFHVILALITSESAHPITPVEPLKPRFYHNSEICLLLFVNNRNIYHILLTISYSELAYPITPVESLKATLYRSFWNFIVFCLLYIDINNNKFTYDKFKVRNSDSAYSICFSQVLLKLFTFLINTPIKRFTTFSIVFYSPNYFITNMTNKQTNKHT